MGVTETIAKLPTSEWARLSGLHPIHFEGIQFPAIQKSLCAQAWFSHSWQDTARTSREDVAEAIATAENAMEQALGFHLMPTWDTDEWQNMPRPYDQSLVWIGPGDLRGFPLSVQPRWGWLDEPGARATSIQLANAAITWVAADANGWRATGTLTVPTTVTEPTELAVYYPGKSPANDRWRIRPLTSVSIVAGVATITIRRELCVIEAILDQMGTAADGPRPADGTDNADFLSAVDVYRVYNDPSQSATLQWNSPAPCGICVDGTCPSCEAATATGCLSIKGDRRSGRWAVLPATWDADTLSFSSPALCPSSRAPDVVRLNYRSGWRTDWLDKQSRIDMDQRWARAVAKFAASLLERDLCDCSPDMLGSWREDLAVSSSDTTGGTSRQISDSDRACPFGTKRGAVDAWHEVQARGMRVPSVAGTR